MTDYSLITELCESRLIPSQTSLKNWTSKKLSELCYLYFIAMRVLLGIEQSKSWAETYCKKTASHNNWNDWRTDGNDFYVLLYAITSDERFSKGSVSTSAVREWFRHLEHKDINPQTQKLFNRLDGMFDITESSLKSLRRSVTQWPETNAREQQDNLDKVIQRIKRLAPNSELLVHLKKVSKEFDSEDEVTESASTGATGVASVATAVGGMGAGFDPDGDRGIYQPDKKQSKKKKTVILGR